MTQPRTATWRARAAIPTVAVLAVALLALCAVCHADRNADSERDRNRPYPDALAEVRERIRHAQAEIDAAQNMLERDSGRLGKLRDKSADSDTDRDDYGQRQGRTSETYDRVKHNVNYAFTPEKYQSAMHRLKAFLGVESPEKYEKIRSAFGMHKSDSIQDQMRHAFGSEPATEKGFWARVKTAIGGDEPLLTKLQTVAGMDSMSTEEMMQRLKTALGSDDLWEKVRKSLEPQRGVMDRILHPFTEPTWTADTVFTKVKDVLKDMDPRQQESTLDRIKIALGLKEPSMWEKFKARYGKGAQETLETAGESSGDLADKVYDQASELLSDDNLEELAHRIKVAIGVEDRTTWEKIRNAIYPEPTISDKVRGWLGYNGLTREQLMERLYNVLEDIDPSRRDSYLTKIKKAIGVERPNLTDKVRAGIASRAESALDTADDLLRGEKYDEVMHKIKVAVGAEDPTVWESIKAAVTPKQTVGDRVRSFLGHDTGISAEDLYERIQDGLDTLMPERRDTITAKIRKVLGFQEPSFFDRLRERFAPDSTLLRGAAYDEIMHKIKVAVGAEDPTVWESIKAAVTPKQTVGDKVRNFFGRDVGISAEDLYERIQEGLSSVVPERRRSLTSKIRKIFGFEEPSFMDRLRDRFAPDKDLLSGKTYDEVMHKIKVALGTEDPTVWESIQAAVTPKQTVGDKVRSFFGRDNGISAQELYERIQEGLSSLAPERRTSVIAKIRKGLGFEEPSFMDRLRERFAPDTGLLTDTTFDELMHKVKMAVGAEDPTVWESIKAAVTPKQTVGDKVRNFFGRDSGTGMSPQELYERIQDGLSSLAPERRESVTTKIRKVFGFEEPSFMDRLRERFAPTSDVLTADSMRDVMHQVKVALGTEDPTVWERVKSVFVPRPSFADRVKSFLGRDGGVRVDDLMSRISDSLSSFDPRRQETIMQKIKTALEDPTFLNKFQALRAVAEKGSDLLRGASFDDAMHQVKMAIGVEDPTLWERVQSVFQPRQGLGAKVSNLFRDNGISREDLVDKVEQGLDTLDPNRRSTLLKKIKESLGIEEQRSIFGRVKDRLTDVFGSKQRESSIDEALNKFRNSSPENRDEAFKALQQALQSAKVNVEEKAMSLFEMLGGKPEPTALGKVQQDFKDYFGNLYSSMQKTIDHFRTDFGRGYRKGYLLESSREENGITSHYVNDNGQETLDITGDKVNSVDKLKLLNSFREEFKLEPHESIPEEASVQLHSVKRPHVLIKNVRYIDGNRYDYLYDDGEETLSVEWNDRADSDKTLDSDTQQRLLEEFRRSHGLSTPTDTSGKVKWRGTVRN